MTRRFTRRTILRSGLVIGAGLMAAPLTRATAFAQSPTPSPVPIPTSPLPPPDLPRPQVVSSVDGVLQTTLRATPAVVDMRAASPVTTYTFDGVVPGRTWEIRAGDTLEFDVVNDLPPIDEVDPGLLAINRPHGWTTTNIHTHGLHVSPTANARGNGDDIFLRIPPGERLHYDIPVPASHTGGLFWYHPHKHGGVTQQIRGGMAGAIIVRGAIDEVEEISAAKEQLMVLQAIELGDQYQLQDPIPHPTKPQAFFPRTQTLYTVNGVMSPKITMYPGEVQRWRILNAAEGKFMSLQLEGHDFEVLAWDGLTLAAPEGAEHLMLSAASRAEVLVKAGAPGTYQLILTPGSSQQPDIPGMPASGSPMSGQPVPPPPVPSSELEVRPILTVEVTGSGPEMGLPTGLPAYDPPIHPIVRQREFAFTVQRLANNEFIEFGVDGFAFDPARAPYQMQLGTAEEWTLFNSVDDRLPRHAHSFHIHQNPFKVTRINGVTLDEPFWRDTWVLTGNTGDSFTFESNFDDFTGKLVEHCHILSHEDLGMMEALEIIPGIVQHR